MLRKSVLTVAFLLAFLATTLASTNEVPQYQSRVWQTDDGLPQNSVQAVTQTRDGYLWIGTQQGLARFDGMRFLVFNERNVPEMKNSHITALCEGLDGSLWIATEHGGLNRLLNGKFFHYGKADGLSGDHALRTLFQRKDGSLWIGTTNGLCRFQDGKFTAFGQSSGLSNLVVRGLCEGPEGALWLATGKGIYTFDGENFAPQAFGREKLKSTVTRTLYVDSQGRIWVGLSGSGLNLIENGKVTHLGKEHGMPDLMVTEVLEDRRGTIWVGTYSGLSRLVGGKFVTELNSEGQPYDVVNCIFEDHEGNLWIGAKDGLHQLQSKRFISYTKREGLSHYNVMSVLENREGTLWIGTWGGRLNQMKSGVLSAFGSDDPQVADLLKNHHLALERVLALHEDRLGQLWLSTDFTGGLFQLSPGKIRHYDKTQGLPEAAVRVIFEDRRGNVWAGTSSGLFVMKKKFFHEVNADDEFTGTNVVHVIMEDKHGRLWVGTDNGLHCSKGGRFINFTTKDGLSHNSVYAICEDADRNLWVGTRGGGLNRVKELETGRGRLTRERFQFTAYTTRHGLFSDDVFEILRDGMGHLWMTCRLGIFCVRRKDFDDLDRGAIESVRCRAFGKNDGMVSVECNSVAKPAAWKSKDGRLWFATARGLVVTDPKSTLKENEVPPPVIIEEVMADKSSVSRARIEGEIAHFPALSLSHLLIPPGRGELEFHYSALSFKEPEKNRFRYKLEGIDPDWVDAGTRRVAYYNNIPPGDYEFRVAGCNSDGVWNSPGSNVKLTLQPHFWQTWWFLGSLGLIGVGSIGGVARYVSVKKIQKKLALLEQQHAVEKERARIARDMHDDLGARLTEILLLSDRSGKNGKNDSDNGEGYAAISGVAREIATNLDALVWAVNPRHDALDKMAFYIYDYVTKFLSRASIQCDLDVPDELPAVALSSELRHNILLVVKEALHNVVEHSGATEVKFRMRMEKSVLSIAIEDNGKGFVLADTSLFGNGLQNMKKRVETSGGCFDLASEAGKGTRIKLEISLKQ